MIVRWVKYDSECLEVSGDLVMYYLKDREDMGEFIKSNYKGRIDSINRIPMKEWFVYHVDDSGDRTFDNFTLLSDYMKDLLENILNFSCLYKELSSIKRECLE